MPNLQTERGETNYSIFTSELHIILLTENKWKKGVAKAQISKLSSSAVTQESTLSTMEFLKQSAVAVIYRRSIIEDTQFVNGT